jgi:hypothetical protein
MNRIRAITPRFLAVASLLLLISTGGCNEPYSPGKILEVTNEVNLFRFQVSDMKNYDQTWSFTWTNFSRTDAIVNQLSTISGGDATLVLKDASGNTVFSRSLKQDGRYTTAVGTTGPWTVQILMNKVSGSVLLQVEPG